MSEQNRPDDRELDDFIAGRSDTSRRYREAVEREGPPESLDHAILGQARRALETDQRAKRRRFVVPLALAATVVLSFSVFVGVRQERAGSSNMALSPEEKSVIARPAPLEAAQMPAPAAPPSVAEAAATRKSAVPQLTEKEFARDQARLQQETDQRKAEQSSMKEQSAMDAVREERMVAPPPAAKPAPPMATGGASLESAPDRQMAAPSGLSTAGETSGRAANLAAEPAKVAPSRAQAKKHSKLRDEHSPSAMFEKIRALKEKGEIDEARGELERFRNAHPDDEIPDDLRPLLRPVTPPSP